MRKTIPRCERIPTLRAAKSGDSTAQQAILDHFESYVNKVSTVIIYLANGGSHTYLDEDIRIQVQKAILDSLCTFDLDGILQGRRPRKSNRKNGNISTAVKAGHDIHIS